MCVPCDRFSRLAASLFLCFLAVSLLAPAAHADNEASRRVISLDGNWQVAEGTMKEVPKTFDHLTPVPGLIDMAQPAFAEVGVKSKRRDVFWYRRTFELDGRVPAVAMLKIHKAMYGTKVFLNGHVVGEHLPCFTPALMDVEPYLTGNGQPNELIIRVGATASRFPKACPAAGISRSPCTSRASTIRSS